MTFANIIVDISHESLDRPFQYIIPEHLMNQVEVGTAVNIPFGRGNRLIKGYVIEITNVIEYDISKLKEIDSIATEVVGTDSDYIKLAWWIKENYGSTMITALKTVLPVKDNPKPIVRKSIQLLVSREEAFRKAAEFDAKHQGAKARLMSELSRTPRLPSTLVANKLNISWSTIYSLEKAKLVQIEEESNFRNPLDNKRDSKWGDGKEKILSASQQAIVDDFVDADKAHIRGEYLLHGVTGSGKTEVYMEIISHVITTGRQAIVLIPEISLTYQTLLRFYQRFGDRVSVMNSKLSKGERADQFERARRGDIDIIIGPRSALFTPFERLGIIIIDEEHEASYKSESVPKYHARDVARKICELKGASLLLGSATPSLEAYYRAKRGDIKLYELKDRLYGAKLPKVYTVDLREELKQGNRSIFSRKLKELIDDRLSKNEQSMLFINRRGYAGFVSCRSCGYVVKCPHCDVSLSEHIVYKDKSTRLVCHYCGYETQTPRMCPTCGSKYILGFRAGTQQIEEVLQKTFPSAKVLRMDADTTRTKDAYDKILSQFANHEADILIGTQMIVKGHDFPLVTLVGALAADMSLHISDYRAAERTFDLLTQAAGRAGRGERVGEVVIQTYNPEHYAIVHAANQDYEGFYNEEIVYRDVMNYPPSSNMMAVLVMSTDELKAREMATELADSVKQGIEKINVMGPTEAVVSKINDVYRQIFYIKHSDYDVLVESKDIMEALIDKKKWDSSLVQFDFNPIN